MYESVLKHIYLLWISSYTNLYQYMPSICCSCVELNTFLLSAITYIMATNEIEINFDESASEQNHLVFVCILQIHGEPDSENVKEHLVGIAKDAAKQTPELIKKMKGKIRRRSRRKKQHWPAVMTALYLKSERSIYLTSSEVRINSSLERSHLIPKLISK